MKDKIVLEKEIDFLKTYQSAIENGYIPLVSSRNLLAGIDYVSSLYEKRYLKEFFTFGLSNMGLVDCQKEFPEEIIDIMNCSYNGNMCLKDNEILIYINNLRTNKNEFIIADKNGRVIDSPLNEANIFLNDAYSELKTMQYNTDELRKIIFSHHFSKNIMDETAKLIAIKIMCCDDNKIGLKRSRAFIKDLNNSFDKFYMTDLFINEFAVELKKKNKGLHILKLFK